VIAACLRNTASSPLAHGAARIVPVLAAVGAVSCAGGPSAPDTAGPPPPVQVAPAYERRDILGADGEAVDALLGAPALVRREGAGEFRRYALRACSLIVILYPDENAGLVAKHVEATALHAGDGKPDLDACLAGG